MRDPQARPGTYTKLPALVVVLGVISVLVTFAFIALIHQSTLLATAAHQPRTVPKRSASSSK